MRIPTKLQSTIKQFTTLSIGDVRRVVRVDDSDNIEVGGPMHYVAGNTRFEWFDDRNRAELSLGSDGSK